MQFTTKSSQITSKGVRLVVLQQDMNAISQHRWQEALKLIENFPIRGAGLMFGAVLWRFPADGRGVGLMFGPFCGAFQPTVVVLD
jgi:hypothetical protein